VNDFSADAICERLRTLFASVETVRVGYLFGSQVDGDTGPLSDVDVGVLLDPSCLDDPTACRAGPAHEIGTTLETDAIDLLLLNRAPIELAYRVVVQGTRVYEESRVARVEYEAYVLGRYGDYLPVLRDQRQQIITDAEDDDRIQRYRAALGRTERTLASLPIREETSADDSDSDSTLSPTTGK
jgi:predicted nucleotidyltransferase